MYAVGGGSVSQKKAAWMKNTICNNILHPMELPCNKLEQLQRMPFWSLLGILLEVQESGPPQQQKSYTTVYPSSNPTRAIYFE